MDQRRSYFSCNTVLLDFAGTLFDDRLLKPHMLANLHSLADLVFDREEREGFDDQTLKTAYKHGMRQAFLQFMSQRYYLHLDFFALAYEEAFASLGKRLPAEISRQAVQRQYDYTITQLRLRDECLETLGALKQQGFHIQLVSNFDEAPMVQAVHTHGLDNVLDAWTSSEAVLSCKPDSGIYVRALELAGCKPEQAVFVGDSVMQDIAGANGAGIHSILIDPAGRHTAHENPAFRPAHSIKSLSELLDYLRYTL